MDILLGLIGLAVGAVAGRMTAPKPGAADGGAADRITTLERQLAEARRAKSAAETALREAEAASGDPTPEPAAPAAAASGDAELLAAENAALRKALAAAEARAARAAMG